ncbi:insulinase family protein [Halomonas sp. ML-15]|uniref:insulinase family protein n=1 Tax=Halomonas sp. ML-15 TaxID=2773305 RepID=UPI001745CE04|nr:insulinase family protein [Halomonas sp. ML-15]MBD3896747.1 insulinase family protein [Halomonas sp. ML-15]
MRANHSDLSQGLPPGGRCRSRRLANGLWLVAAEVPDAHLTRLAGAIDLGYLDEPAVRPGLTHLLEHALFLGSRRWPEVDALSRWVGEQGGRYNAYTGDTATDVHLQLPPAAAEAGLERLCDLLASPCFDPALIEHEVGVLDAEFRARLADPELHRLAALGQLCRPGHPAQQCHAGHATSLAGSGDALAAELRALHRHYRPARMALAMLGPQPLEQQLDLLAHHAALLAPVSVSAEPAASRTWRWAEPGGVVWQLPDAAQDSNHCVELLWPLPTPLANAYRPYLDGVAARLADGALAEALSRVMPLTDMQVTPWPAGAGPALSLRLATTATPPPLSDLLAILVPALNEARRRPLAAPAGLASAERETLDRWPRHHARRLAGQPPGGTAPALGDGQEALAAWLAPDQCRLLWQQPSAASSCHDWRRLAETGTPVKRVALPQPRASFTLPPRQPGPMEGELAASAGAQRVRGHPAWPGSEAISHCALGWPAVHDKARLGRWRQRCLALGQTATAEGAALQLGGDRLGDWLLAIGTPDQVLALTEQALMAWPATPAAAQAPATNGLVAQRLLDLLETAPPPSDPPAAKAQAALCWSSDRLGDAELAPLLGRCPVPSAAAQAATPPSATLWLAPQAADHAVMLEVMGADASPRSRWLLRLLGQCHDAAFQQALRQRQGLGYAAAVRYREAAGWPRLGYVVQSPHADIDALRGAIEAFIAAETRTLSHLSSAALATQRRGLLARHAPPETYPDALKRVWQRLRQAPPSTLPSALPERWLCPWQEDAEKLAHLTPQDLQDSARALAAQVLPQRWWYHRPAGH